jgi:hypothetical protein
VLFGSQNEALPDGKVARRRRGQSAMGDLSGDGKLDLVVVSGSSLTIYLGGGDGTFAPPRAYAAGGRVSVADLGGDGELEIIAESSVLRGTAR